MNIETRAGMPSQRNLIDTGPAYEGEIMLAMLKAVHGNSGHTQRSLARELGIALGMVNAYLKRCVVKGYVKISQVPPRRYAYYLTATGFSEKTRLTGEYLRQSLRFMQEARGDCAKAFETCARNRWTRVMLQGLGELLDIALLCARETEIEIVGIIDAEAGIDAYHGIPVHRDYARAATCDAVVITALADPQAAQELLLRHLPPRRVLSLALLDLAPPAPAPVE